MQIDYLKTLCDKLGNENIPAEAKEAIMQAIDACEYKIARTPTFGEEVMTELFGSMAAEYGGE